jgi:hypothetical protein
MNFRLILPLILSLLLITAFSAMAQNGFLGRKSMISIDGLANIPVLSGAFREDYYRKRGNEMKATKDLIDFGASLRYAYGIGKRFGLGAEFTLRQMELMPERYYISAYGGEVNYSHATSIRIEPLKTNSWYFSMMYLFYPKRQYFGSGLAHKLSAGYTLSHVHRGSYNYSLNEFYIGDSTNTQWSPVDKYYIDEPAHYYHGITLSYGVQLTIPLTNWFQFKVAGDIYGTLYTGQNESILQDENSLVKSSDLFDKIQREQIFNWHANFGLVFML